MPQLANLDYSCQSLPVGFENRDYIREGDYTGTLAGWGLEYISPVVKWLIVANVVVWLLQIFITRQ